MNLKKRASTCTGSLVGSSSVLSAFGPVAASSLIAAMLVWLAVASVPSVTLGQSAAAADAAKGSRLEQLHATEGNDPDLGDIKRICVAPLSGDEGFSQQVREMLISSLFATKRFKVTEDCDRADATMKGTATENKERVGQLESEGVGFGQHVGAARGSWTSSGGSVSAGGAGVAGSTGETLASSTVKNNTNLAVRLVNHDGDVIWATTQESTGNKIRGPAADVADRAVKQLIRDLEKTLSPQKTESK